MFLHALATAALVLAADPPPANFYVHADLSQLRGAAGTDGEAIGNDLRAELTADLKTLKIAAMLDLASLDPVWELADAEFTAAPSVRELVRAEKGYADTIEGAQVVWSSRNAYFMPKGNSVLAMRPASRQVLAKWLRAGKESPGKALAAEWEKVAEKFPKDAALSFALDVRDAISPTAAMKKLPNLAAMKDKSDQVGDVAVALESLQWLYFTVQCGDASQGTLRLSFGAPATAMATVGKPLLIEVLAARGLTIPDLAKWNAKVDGSDLVLSGSISPATVNYLLNFLTTPASIGSAHRGSKAPENAENADPTAAVKAATKKYLADVRKSVETVRDFRATTAGERGTWNERYGRKINNLPTLNVDPEAISYGAQVASLMAGTNLTIREAGFERSAGQSTMMVAGYGYGYGAAYDWNNAFSQNEAATIAANRKGTMTYKENLAKIDEMTGDIRRRMTAKYMEQF